MAEINDLVPIVSEFAHWSLGQLQRLVTMPVNPHSRMYWLYLLSALLLAVVAYNRYEKRTRRFYLKDFLKFVCPKEVYSHPSAIVDYKLLLANRLIKLSGLVTGFLSRAAIATYVAHLLASIVGSEWQGVSLNGWTMFAFTLVYILVGDFAKFVNHAMHHFVPILWPIHSVHHSAEVLNLFTVSRIHPLYGVVRLFSREPIVGVFQGITIFLFLGEVDPLTIFNINVFYALFLITGAPLRHTHIWLSYGPILNYILISPAHHQIHHSARPEHRNCNMGIIFALWDWMFGTLVLPTEEIRTNLIFGIKLGEPQRHPTLARAYFEPLESMFKVLKRSLKPA